MLEWGASVARRSRPFMTPELSNTEKSPDSVARLRGGRWFPILLPGPVRTAFYLGNLRPLSRGVTQPEQVPSYRLHLSF